MGAKRTSPTSVLVFLTARSSLLEVLVRLEASLCTELDRENVDAVDVLLLRCGMAETALRRTVLSVVSCGGLETGLVMVGFAVAVDTALLRASVVPFESRRAILLLTVVFAPSMVLPLDCASPLDACAFRVAAFVISPRAERFRNAATPPPDADDAVLLGLLLDSSREVAVLRDLAGIRRAA